MYLPPLQTVANSDIRISGDVEIHPTASIASGVILQATPNSKIIIGADACIGMGVIITAYQGLVEISEGATLGSGVLIVGHGKVGSNACVGTASTVFNASVDSMKVITPGSIIGDISRSEATEETIQKPKTEPKTEKPKSDVERSNNSFKSTNNQNNNSQTKKIGNNYFFSKNQNLNNKEDTENKEAVEKQIIEDQSDPWLEKDITATEFKEAANTVVKEIEKNNDLNASKAMGRIYIDRLLVTLFPHKKLSNDNIDSK